MAGFLYYAPGRQRALTTKDATEQAFHELGLEHLQGAQGVVSRAVMAHGPDGQSGLLIALSNVREAGYYPERQTWRKCDGGAYWVGWYRDDPPRPDELAREMQIPGHTLTLGDGQEWLIPAARFYDQFSKLPGVYGLDADGNVTHEVLPVLRPFQEQVEQFLEAWKAFIEAGEIPSYDQETLFELCGAALSLNYRLGKWEALAYGLLATQPYGGRADAMSIGAATIDWPTVARIMDEHAKKNELADGSASGAADDFPDTGQPSETCG